MLNAQHVLEVIAADPTVPISKAGGLVDKLIVIIPSIIAFGLVAYFIMKVWKMLMQHPVLFAIIAIMLLAMTGVIAIKK